jgi:hypothetical protein
MGLFFIDTDTGQVATQSQLIDAGMTERDGLPPRPWLQVRGSGDATTLWHAVMRREEKGIFIGTLVFRHSDHHASLLQRGWQEIPPGEIGIPGTAGAPRVPERTIFSASE